MVINNRENLIKSGGKSIITGHTDKGLTFDTASLGLAVRELPRVLNLTVEIPITLAQVVEVSSTFLSQDSGTGGATSTHPGGDPALTLEPRGLTGVTVDPFTGGAL